MCGIMGLVGVGGHISPDVYIPFAGALEHRGPDDDGWLILQGGEPQLGKGAPPRALCEVFLRHRRLSILDLSPAGWQPMTSRDGRYVIVFNGEIYNHLALRGELEREGVDFRSRSDTEVLLELFARRGTAALAAANGMFALAILDLAERRITLARDAFGIKPLYWTRWEGGFAFASEIPPLLSLPGVGRDADPQRLFDYLRFGLTDHGDGTMFRQIRQLPTATSFEVDLETGQISVPERHWALAVARRPVTFEEAAARVRDQFLENVRLHLRSDVPVGVALSGGVDSSAIAGAMRRLLGPDVPIRAFTYVADDARINEESWAELVARALKLELHKVIVQPKEAEADLERLISIQGEPFGSTSIYAQFRVFQRARAEGIVVMLDGQGGDELFGGYHFTAGARLADLLTSGRLVQAAGYLSGARSSGVRRRDMVLWAVATLVPTDTQGPLRKLIGKGYHSSWADAMWFEKRGVAMRSQHVKGADGSRVGEHLRNLVEWQILPHLLRYEDRNSMAFSVESRVPFLTPALADLAFSLPVEHLVHADGLRKKVFREAMRGIVPDEVLDRRDKIGFETPEHAWLGTLTGLFERSIESEAAKSIPFLDRDALRRSWAEVVAGRRPFDPSLWRWLNLIEWTRIMRVEYR